MTSQVLPTTAANAVETTAPELSPGRRGLTITRHLTSAGDDIFDSVTWERRDAVIANERGETIFEQRDVEVPAPWSQMATNVVVSKYFRGTLGTPERETSVRQLISRVVQTLGHWGRAQLFFATEDDARAFEDELGHLLLHQ